MAATRERVHVARQATTRRLRNSAMADRVRSVGAAALQVETTLNQLDDFTQLGTSTMQQFSEFVAEADHLILRLGRIITLFELVLAPAMALLHVVNCVPARRKKRRRAGALHSVVVK